MEQLNHVPVQLISFKKIRNRSWSYCDVLIEKSSGTGDSTSNLLHQILLSFLF